MSNNRILIGAAVATFALNLSAPGLAQDAAPSLSGATVFNQRCKSCHEPAVERAPGRAELAFRAPADIVSALTTGVMAPMAKGLSRPEIEAVALFLAPGQQLGSVGSDRMCAANGPIKASASDWPALGPDENSTRFQPNPQLRAADVANLKVKWAFSMTGGGQPVVVGDWLFVTNRGGKFYALDANSGCVHWAVEDASSRTTPMVIRSSISPSGWATFIGVKRAVRAFDAQSGKEIWRSESLENHVASMITGTPVISGDQIFVPLSSGEEVVAMQPNYSCCTFRGSLAALDLKTGKKQWQTYMITEPLRPTRKNANGIQMQGPAGAPIWASPTVDAKRGLVYVVTGDSYTDATTDGDDAVVAVEMKTGKVRWRNQVTTNDNFIVGCSGPIKVANCPAPTGPDFDFGATPILFKHGNKQILVAGQKSGIVYGVDPDSGRTLWKTAVGAGSPLGGVEWGIGADAKYVFVPNSDIGEIFNEIAIAAGAPSPAPENAVAGKPGLFALDPFSGRVVWNTPAPKAPCHYSGDRSKDYTKGACVRAQSAAPAVMPGVVFSGTLDGWFRAYDAASGKVIWEFSTTAQTYNTVNGNPAQPGGGIDGMGPTIAGGMVYTMSGFNGAARTGSNGVNVLLAFSVDGK